MSDDLQALAYVSRISPTIGPERLAVVVQDILGSCQRNNQQYAVTGVLLVGQTHFAQMLEGPRWAVETVMRIVARDPRHSDIHELFIEPLTGRRFGKWAMAYATPPGQIGANRVIGVVTSPDQIGFGPRGRDLAQDMLDLLACTEAESRLAP